VNEIRDQNLQISAAAEEQHSVAEEINRHIQQIYDEARLVEGGQLGAVGLRAAGAAVG
jgi:methyl-accepting chemotaxis protein